MNAEIFAALAQLEKERGIPQSYMVEKITQALVAAYKKDKDGYTDNVFVEVKDNDMHMYVQKEVVDDVITPATEITLDAARRISKTAQLGDLVNVDVQTKDFGRIAAQTAKQVVVQRIREAERGNIYDEYVEKENEILTAIVQRVEKGNAFVELGKTDGILTQNEMIPGESYEQNQRIKVYVLEVRKDNKGPQVLVSRTHPGLVKRLFELEVPEIYDGTVEVRSIAREAGNRTKIAVWSEDPNVDAIGACVGPRGQRVNAIVDELRGEKIDIVKWSEDISEFISAALSPAKVVKVELLPGETRSCRVTVPDQQLSLAIGNKGQNARLCARLTGYNIDIRPESGYYGEDEEPKAAEPKTEDAE